MCNKKRPDEQGENKINNLACGENKDCCANVLCESADSAVYPVQAVYQVKVLSRKVERLVLGNSVRLTAQLNDVDTKPCQPVLSAQLLHKMNIVGELYCQKQCSPDHDLTGFEPNNSAGSLRYYDEPTLNLLDLFALVREVGLPLMGEMSRYRHDALWAPLLDALDEKVDLLLSPLVELSQQIKAVKAFKQDTVK